MWDSVKSVIGTAAPLLGTVLGGPAGAAVGTLVSSCLGVDNTEEAVSKALASPDSLVKIKELELTHKAKLEELTLEYAKLEVSREQNYLKDIQDARKNHKDHWMPSVLTIVLALMVAGMYGTLIVSPATSEVMIMITGTVLGAFSTAIAFWLGSSKGSWDKQKQITEK